MASARGVSTEAACAGLAAVDSRTGRDDDPRVSRLARSPTALIGVVVLVGYSAVAWVVGSFYPFSVFPMYAQAPQQRRAARLGARTAAGDMVELTRYRAFDCDRALDPDGFDAVCGARAYAPAYLDDELSHHVVARSAEVPHGEPIEIVRRVWTIAEDGSLSSDDCVLARCTAAP